jgi:uncharacterized protein involved in exopolysaccharide biosynthesis
VSTDSNPRQPGSGGGGDIEQEVELSRYWYAILARWWLIVLGIGLGILVGYLVSIGGGKVFQAKATVYLGQPLNPGSSAQVQGPGTNPSIVSQIVRSTSVVDSVAQSVGVPPGKLRSGISSSAVSSNVAKTGQTPLVTITVRGPWKRQTADAANRLAEIVINRTSPYASSKIDVLAQQLQSQNEQLDALNAAITQYEAGAADSRLQPAEKLAAVGLLNSAVVQRGQLIDAKTQTELQLSLAKTVEKGEVVTRAAPTKVTARGRRSSIIVGAVIGLLLGVLAALVWDPLARRIGKAGP